MNTFVKKKKTNFPSLGWKYRIAKWNPSRNSFPVHLWNGMDVATQTKLPFKLYSLKGLLELKRHTTGRKWKELIDFCCLYNKPSPPLTCLCVPSLITMRMDSLFFFRISENVCNIWSKKNLGGFFVIFLKLLNKTGWKMTKSPWWASFGTGKWKVVFCRLLFSFSDIWEMITNDLMNVS